MHAEITRILTEWAKDSTYGVNAMLEGLTRNKTTSGTTTDTAPKKVDIYNDVDYDVTREGGILPPTQPSLVIVCDSLPKTIDITNPTAPGHKMNDGWTAGFGYYGDQGDRADAILQGSYVLRAVKKSLTRYNRAPDARKTLNSIFLARVSSVEFQRAAGAVPGSTFLGLLFADLTVLDKAP